MDDQQRATSKTAGLRLAVIGTGISGMSAAWLLSQRHDVTVYERNDRVGGHSPYRRRVGRQAAPSRSIPALSSITRRPIPISPPCSRTWTCRPKPRTCRLRFRSTAARLEYSGGGLCRLFAQKRNLFRPRFWSMLNDIHRFYREAPTDVTLLDELHTTLGDYLDTRSYGPAFRDDHLLPMAGAIWSAPPQAMLAYPGDSFIRFHDNHGLLQVA